MKTTTLLTVLMVGTMTNSCTHLKEKSAIELLENPQMRQELFMSILSNREYTSQFIDSLARNEHGQKVILENDSLVKIICISSKMDNLINTDDLIMNHVTKSLIKKIEIDSVACDRTCTQLMETKRVKDFLNEHSAKK